MANLKNQRRMASQILDCGTDRVWLDPAKMEEIAQAITREDIRGLIAEGTIKAKKIKGVSRGRARLVAEKRKYGHRKGPGSRKGKKGARTNSKELWMKKIRALRRKLKEMRANESIDKKTYCKFYRKAKGGEFRNVAHLEAHLKVEE
ncbi:MAG: 50S ribosomal protein L19e [Methanosarcinales archaeon]|jgi:large subunit ribosomal protein L19e|nr:50S ribosomal protein L19e [Methanosarcinales archaeon]